MASPGPRPSVPSDTPKCLLDPLSVVGLRRLQREQPHRWAIIVADHLPDLPVLSADMTVGTALRGAVLDWSAMQKLGPSAFRRHRQSCAKAVQAAGRMKLGDIDDVALQEVRGKLVRQRMAAESTSRVLTILRKLARSYAQEVGTEPTVTSRPTKVVATRLFVKPPARPLWSPEEVARLLAVLRDRGARAAVALAAGCGLLPVEVLNVALGDLDLRKHLLVVYGTDRSRRPRVAALAPWVEDLLKDWVHHYAREGRPQSPWLFPAPRDPARPRADFTRLLQSAHGRAGAGLGHLPPVTLLDLRRTFQWVMVRAGLPRECVRGTWSMSSGEWPPWWPALQKLVRREWKSLTGLDRERWPRGCGSFVRTSGGLVPAEVAEARRKMLQEPPPLPSSAMSR
mgnify:CR=1 FL=1